MPASPLLLLCRAPAEVAASLFSAADADPNRPLGLDVAACRRLEDAAAQRLADAGLETLLAPHAYHLTPDHEAVRLLLERGEPFAAAAWMSPRALRWTLSALGLPNPTQCYDLRTFDSPDAFADAALASAETRAEPGRVTDLGEDARPRWYPVLDYDLCVSCKQCYEFCMFGVFELVEGRVAAVQPDNCKPGCPACARVCPKGAILFPHYLKDPGIAGEPGASIAESKIDVDAFFSQCALGSKPKPEETRPRRDDLDELIDQLDALDEAGP